MVYPKNIGHNQMSEPKLLPTGHSPADQICKGGPALYRPGRFHSARDGRLSPEIDSCKNKKICDSSKRKELFSNGFLMAVCAPKFLRIKIRM